jgi:hypothetical protein
VSAEASLAPLAEGLETLAGFSGLHRGATIVVCGCGPSLNDLPLPPASISIGVNDVGRRFDPDYLVVVNPPAQFPPDRRRAIEESRARAVFTQYPDWRLERARRTPIVLGAYGGTDFADKAVLHFTRNSPYVALCLAVKMGAARIGLIGVDFTDDHFFGATGRHPLAGCLDQIDAEYIRLRDACNARGVEVVNLSPVSRLTAFPRAQLATFLQEPRSRIRTPDSLRIVSYATTPIAGVPGILARCIAATTAHQPRCVWATNSYGNGVAFDGDLEWQRRPDEAEAALADADVVIAHNGKIEDRHRKLIDRKPVVTVAHNYAWNVDVQFVEQGLPGLVVGQYQATLPEFVNWAAVPNPIPLWEAAFSPEPKGDVVTIAYTPSGRHESYPEGHRLYWHGKGYETTMRVLDALARRYPIAVLAVGDRQMSHADALAAKRRAHIVIDECVTGSYHRNSLEGLACGAVVVNGVGLLPAVTRMLLHCAGNTADVPFVHASRDTLERVLSGLIETGPAALAETGRVNRAWLEANWDFADQWRRFWEPAIERATIPTALGRRVSIEIREHPPNDLANTVAAVSRPELPPHGGRHTQRNHITLQQGLASQPHAPTTAKADPPECGLSVVIPFGGRHRLGLLATTLAGVRQSTAVDQVIIAESGSEPAALDLARRWDADHVFIPSSGPFDKARALNSGSLLARRPELLWCDGDLLFGESFVVRALQEFKTKGLDFLFPFSRICYLDDAESREVRAGARSLADCRPIRELRPIRGGAIGGMGLLRADFLRRHGGMIEGFLGWGGEDNAWVKKVSLLGRVGVTQHVDQVAWHLHHPDSGATGAQPWRSNPHYARNLELLVRIQRIGTADEFLRQFPHRHPPTPPWAAGTRIALVAVDDGSDGWTGSLANAWEQRLKHDYGATTELVQTDAARLTRTLHELCADAVVVLVDDAAACVALATVRHGRPTVLALGASDPDTAWPAAAAGCPWLLARTTKQVAEWRRRGLAVWHRAWDDSSTEAQGWAPLIVQPLSHMLSARAQAELPPPAAPAGSKIPVWTYWEGPMPEWIARCLDTARRHAPSIRVLGPDDFDALRDRDRDIELSNLHVAQRADFVRAFLLARLGGLWIDADCVVMRELAPLLDQLGQFDMIAHRERQGLFSNAFFAAKPGSVVAARFYETVCARLRARRPLGWISLGNEPLTEVLNRSPEPRLELPTEQVQPVCWSRPEAYFRLADELEHARDLDTQAWCYMLSQQNIIRHQKSAPAAALMAERSFFSFLVRHALNGSRTPVDAASVPHRFADAFCVTGARPVPPELTEAFERICAEHVSQGHESVSGPGSSLRQTAEIRGQLPLLLEHLNASVLLDAPCGDFHWMAKVRLGVETYIGVDLLEDQIRRNSERHAAPGRSFLALNILEDRLPRADVVLCRDCLGHLPCDDIVRVLRNFVATGSRYLLTTTFPGRSSNTDIRSGQWRPLNLQIPPFSLPTPLQILNEKCSESAGAFKDKSLGLWRLADVPLHEW